MILSGKTICQGLVRGVTHVIDGRAALSAALAIPPQGSANEELERLHAAISHACVELDRVQRQLTGRVHASDVAIFESHAALLRDPKFVKGIEGQIREHGQSAEAAVSRVVNQIYADFMGNRVSLVQDKAADVLDIGRRLLHCLSSAPSADVEVGEAAVIVASALTPSDMVRFAHLGVAALITETCGTKSHTAILARGFAIPMITGIPSACEIIPDHTEVVVDAGSGKVFVAPSADEEQALRPLFERKIVEISAEEFHQDPPITSDGVRIQVLLNVSDPVEVETVRQLGADGVGLFRTEFLYMDRDWWPSEEESYQLYRQAALQLKDAELNVRLVDFGAEKCPTYADIPMNRNPSLGLRGVRLLLQREDILKPQVAALARVARERPMTLLIPMLDTLDTLEATIEKLCLFSGAASREQLPFKLGTMIEVPSAAFLIDEIVERVDSVAIGLNDLTQYLLAADRDDEYVERYHDPLQPVLLRLVASIVKSAQNRNKPVLVCGELAGDAKLTGLLLALGFRKLSVSRSSYLAVVESIRNLSLRSMTGVADEILKMRSSESVRNYVRDHFGSGA